MIDWQPRRVPAELETRYTREGYWTDETLGTLLAAGLDRHAELTFSIRSQVNPYRGTFGDVAAMARRVAGALRSRGIGPGDVVAFQLPNRVEAAVLFYAVSFLGAVIVPIVHFYGTKEVGYILRRSRPRVFVTSEPFGHVDFLANLEQLRPDIPEIELEVVAGRAPSGMTSFAELLEADPIDGPAQVDPRDPALVAYTSGTTADPKGVVHVHRTIVFEVKQLGAVQPPGPPNLFGYPVGHAGGMLGSLLLPVNGGKPIYLLDMWDPAVVLQAMLEENLTSGGGAVFFLMSLLDHPDLTPRHLELMHYVGLGMSPVPAAIADRATAKGLSVVRMYGSTEHPSITGATHDAPLEKRLYTDGAPLPGVEVRLLDDDGKEVEPGQPGVIHSRGPDCCMGYSDAALTARMFDADGWYDTEDVGVQDADGYVAIVDRRKDIIIRGGENVSAMEVEEQVLRMPGVAEVAVVAAPDARLGEHACAFVRLSPGTAPPDLPAIRGHLEAAGLARQKWPEELHVVDDFPRTASGKIQKFVLRDRLRAEAAARPG